MTPEDIARIEEAARAIQDEVGATYVKLRDHASPPGTIRDGRLVVFRTQGDQEVSISLSGRDCIQYPGTQLADMMEVRVRTAVKHAT